MDASLPDTSTNGVHAPDEDAPLPKLQLLLLSYTRIIEPIAFFSIFPYITSMIETVGGKAPEDASVATPRSLGPSCAGRCRRRLGR